MAGHMAFHVFPMFLVRNQIRDTLSGETGKITFGRINPLNAELNPICHLLELLGAHPILHISRIRVKYKFRTSSKKNSKLRIIYWYIERV